LRGREERRGGGECMCVPKGGVVHWVEDGVGRRGRHRACHDIPWEERKGKRVRKEGEEGGRDKEVERRKV
jgi:hypothetical protein